MHVRYVVDRTYSRRLVTSAKRRRSLARYDHDGEMQDSDRWTNVASLKSTRWRTGSQCIADGAPALCVWTSSTRNKTGGGVLNRLQSVHRAFRDAEEQRVAVVQATGDERLYQCFTRIFRRWPDLSLIHIWRCRRIERCRSRWSPYH